MVEMIISQEASERNHRECPRSTVASQATQCADRFHLLANLSTSLEGFLSRYLATHRIHIGLESRTTPLSPVQGKVPPKKNPKRAQERQAKREEHLTQYQQVVALRKQPSLPRWEEVMRPFDAG